MKELINDFPRQVAFPQRKLVNTESDFYRLVEKYNGVKDCYFSIYGIDEKGGFQNSKVSKIFFDFDGEEQALINMRKLVYYLYENDIKHLILYSGKKGFHVYVFTIDYEELKNPKASLMNCHLYFENKIGFKLDDPVRGNIAQIARIPNTFHISGKRYCIPINRNDIYKDLQFIRDKAKEQSFTFTIYGQKLLDMKQFDTAVPESKKIENIPEFSYVIEIEDNIVRRFPPCIQRILMEPKEFCNNRSRYIFTIFCRDRGIPPKLCEELAKKYWSGTKESGGIRSKYREFKDENQIKWAYENSDKPVPNCDTLYQKGICPGKCSQYTKNNFPLYFKENYT